MDNTNEFLEALWSDLLSRQPEKVQTSFFALDETSQQYVLGHLKRMVSDPGWQPEQRTSAKAALKALKKPLRQEKNGNQ